MAADIYEYTDAQGRTHQVDDLMKVPKDRLQHMLVIGGENAPATQAAVGVPPAPPPAKNALGGVPLEAWAVSAFLMTVAVFNKRFMLRLFCASTAVIWLLYSGYDSFTQSDLARMSERKPKKPAAAPREPAADGQP